MKKITKDILIILFLLSGLSSNIFSQSSNNFESISIKDGLSHNVIWDFEQDKYGYMWIATTDGLNMYDGYNFTIYKNDPADSSSLPANLVTNVLEDNDGVLWISTSNGLSRFDRKTEKFKNYKYSNEPGENANFIGYLFKDSKGILWVCSNDGFRSFDKKSETFTAYEVLRDDNVVTHFSNPTYVMLETKSGELYGSSISYGLVKFDYENKLFVQIKLKDDFQNKIRRNVNFSLSEGNNGIIWYSSLKGLFKIDTKNLSAEQVLNSFTGRNYYDVGSLYKDKNNKMWIGTWRDGLYQYDLSTSETTKLPPNNLNYFGTYEDNNGILWLGNAGGILKYNFDKTPFELYTFTSSENQEKPIALSMAQSNKNQSVVWIGTTKGLYTFDKIKKSIGNSASLIPAISNGSDLNIEDVIETKSGKLYLGTTANGLFSYDLLNRKLEQYKPVQYSRTSLRFNDVNALFEDSKNRVWVGQEDGLSILNEKEKSFTRIPNLEYRQYSTDLISYLHKLRESNTPLLQMIQVGDFADLSKEFVLSNDSYVLISGIGEGQLARGVFDYGMLQTVEGDTLWSMTNFEETFNASGVSKNRQKIGLMELKKGRYKLLYKSDDSHSFESYNAMPPQDSLYWGIELYTVSENDFQKYQPVLHENTIASFMKGKNVMAIYESTDNLIWVATMDGLSIVDPKSFSIKNLTMDSEDGLSISSNFVEDVCEDNYGNIWIATQDGLNKYDRKKNKVTVYREKEGLPTNRLRALQMDDEGNLWVSSIKGISKVEISDSSKSPIFVNYDVRDGLQGYTFIGNGSIKDSDGKLYFAGLDGFNSFSPGVTDKTLPKVVFNSISVSNKSIDDLDEGVSDTRDLNSLEELNLSYNQNDISFEFASIHFARPDKNRLQYKMEGVDEVWHDGSKQIATYANLDPGDYVFKVKGSNGDGLWNENPKEIKISITPAWWANTYAYIGYVVIFFGFLFGVRKFEMERRSRVNEYKQSELRAEAAELKAIAAEAERKMLAAENDRKTQELEEARSLQLSMLPKVLPQLPNLDIAVYMKTATEVGGDYYDFNVAMDGTLTVVLGDATGHGMRAGTMVTSTKSLFNSYAANPDILFTFREMTRCIKQMQFQSLAMSMTMLKVRENKLLMSAAGMPPVFIYKSKHKIIEEHLMEGMPLGTMDNFPYELKKLELLKGDTILLMSDGFPELNNQDNEMFGYKRARNSFEEVAEKEPEEIISYLQKEGSRWVNYKDPDDDVTFVVIKVKK